MKILATGSSGLVGSALVERFCLAGHTVVGIDNDGRGEFFGDAGSTADAGTRLRVQYPDFSLRRIDVRDIARILEVFEYEREIDAVVHCAAQPSHDWAAGHPLEDFDVNARGTLNVLEACRRHCLGAPFVFMSTNKVYGDALNDLTREGAYRFDFDLISAPEQAEHGISESDATDLHHSIRTIYGAGKLAADQYVQEYGNFYGMRTVCLRAGCITGAGHAAVPLHGFLSYLVKCNVGGSQYVVKGYKGKQVRDNIHAADLARLIDLVIQDPPEPGSVYNVGGGKANSCSILEAFDAVQEITERPMLASYDDEPRRGDHACYYTDLRKVMRDYPEWRIERDLPSIYRELVEDWRGRLG